MKATKTIKSTIKLISDSFPQLPSSNVTIITLQRDTDKHGKEVLHRVPEVKQLAVNHYKKMLRSYEQYGWDGVYDYKEKVKLLITTRRLPSQTAAVQT